MAKKKPDNMAAYKKKHPSKANGGAMGKSTPQVGGGSASKKKMPMKQGQGGGKPGTPKMKASPKTSKPGSKMSPFDQAVAKGMNSAVSGAKNLGKAVKGELDKEVGAFNKAKGAAKDLLDPVINPGKYLK
jgi:hypothetical protein